MRARRVRALLMGGQACVFYDAAESSRDTDFAILAAAGGIGKAVPRQMKGASDIRQHPAQGFSGKTRWSVWSDHSKRIKSNNYGASRV
jgi:hypothetical protein